MNWILFPRIEIQHGISFAIQHFGERLMKKKAPALSASDCPLPSFGN